MSMLWLKKEGSGSLINHFEYSFFRPNNFKAMQIWYTAYMDENTKRK